MTSLNATTRTLLAFLLALSLAAPAFSQDEDDLRDENTALQAQIRSLEQQLDDANAKIARLERMIERMQADQSASEELAQEEEVTIDETKPDASPRAVLREIIVSHDKAMGDVEMDRPNSRQRTAYMRALEKWVAAAEREFKLPIEWHVRFVEEWLMNRDGSAKATLVAVDPKTNAQLGEPFDVVLDGAIMRRLAPIHERGDLDKMKLNGVVVPHVRVNPERQVRGPFDSPRFVGPFAEYAMEVQVRSLVPVEKPKDSPPKRDAQGTEKKDPAPNPRPTPDK